MTEIKNNSTSDSSKKNIVYACIVIPPAIITGTISGISGVIASYFFKPVWNKITKIWEKNDEQNTY